MIDRQKLSLAEVLIEKGEIKKAKQTLLEILEASKEGDDIDIIIKNANTIIALEIIDQVIQNDPMAVEELKQELSAKTETTPCETSAKIEEMIAKGLL